MATLDDLIDSFEISLRAANRAPRTIAQYVDESLEGTVRESFAFKTFHFHGGKILEASVLITLIGALALAALNVLLTVLFNLISDLVGGVRISVIEEETARPLPAEGDRGRR